MPTARVMSTVEDLDHTPIGAGTPNLQAPLMERADYLHDYVRRRIPSDIRRVVAADDILQDVWIAAFRGIGRFQPNGPYAFDRWLFRITQRKLLDCIRDARSLKHGGGRRFKRRTRSSYLELFACVAAGGRTPSSEDAAREASQAVQVALGALPDDYREAITLRHLEGRSLPAVAKLMERSPPAIRGLLYRGLRMLRRQLRSSERFFGDVA